MPDAKRKFNHKSQTINKKVNRFPVSRLSFKVPKEGFTLVEILLSLFFIIAIVTILFSTSGSLLTRRKSDQQSIAAKVATKEIERLRGLPYSGGAVNTSLLTQSPYDLGVPPPALPNSGCPSQYPAPDPNNDLKNLRSGQLCRNLYDYAVTPTPPNTSDPIAGTTKVVGVKITVYWKNDNNVSQNLSMDTIIAESGL